MSTHTENPSNAELLDPRLLALDKLTCDDLRKLGAKKFRALQVEALALVIEFRKQRQAAEKMLADADANPDPSTAQVIDNTIPCVHVKDDGSTCGRVYDDFDGETMAWGTHTGCQWCFESSSYCQRDGCHEFLIVGQAQAAPTDEDDDRSAYSIAQDAWNKAEDQYREAIQVKARLNRRWENRNLLRGNSITSRILRAALSPAPLT